MPCPRVSEPLLSIFLSLSLFLSPVMFSRRHPRGHLPLDQPARSVPVERRGPRRGRRGPLDPRDDAERAAARFVADVDAVSAARPRVSEQGADAQEALLRPDRPPAQSAAVAAAAEQHQQR